MVDPVENAVINSVVYNMITVNQSISEDSKLVDQEIIDAMGESNA
jgi:hypothetical protein